MVSPVTLSESLVQQLGLSQLSLDKLTFNNRVILL